VLDSALPKDVDAVFFRAMKFVSLPVVFTAADYFHNDDTIIFLKPDRSEELIGLHNQAVEQARSCGLTARHYGDSWVPHCTCDYRISQQSLFSESINPETILVFASLHSRSGVCGGHT
jgi:hypothetical protein